MNCMITKGIQIPAYDLELLRLGKLIAVPFKHYQRPEQPFWLYPGQLIPADLKIEHYYKEEYIESAEKAFSRSQVFPLRLSYWASIDEYWHIYPAEQEILPKLSQSTIWSLQALETILANNQVIRLLFLRVHRLSQDSIIRRHTEPGPYFWPHHEDTMTQPTESFAVVSDRSFKRRKALIQSGEVNPYLSLETLQLQIEESVNKSSETIFLNYSLNQVLGYAGKQFNSLNQPEWISRITALGNRSVIEDAGKSNYQAGTDFENIVRQSLEFLGFQVDYSHHGGAGGLDIFCSRPYPLVIECKSGKKIPNDTAVQLLNLGTLRLGDGNKLAQSTKLIIGPGKPTDQLRDAAIVHGMAIINPSTLEKLVKLHSKYPIDLFKLKDYLLAGQADDEVDRFIEKCLEDIELRSQIVNLVKGFLDTSGENDVSISQLHAFCIGKIFDSSSKPLTKETMHEILLELASPLTGYLGRRKSEDGDRFYFLRSFDLSM